MSYTTIGSIIEQARKEKKYITRKKLSAGICSPQMLYQIEKNLCESDPLMTDILLQRAGKTPDKLERMLKSEMYRLVRIRSLLENAILKRKRELSMQILTNYPNRTNVDQMYQYRMKASIYYHIDKNYEKTLKYLKQAINKTLPNFTYEAIDQYLISTFEMENLLAVKKVQIEQNLENTIPLQSEQHLKNCMRYIDLHFTDDEEHAKIFAKCTWLRAQIAYHNGKYIQVITLCEKSIEELRRNTMIYFMQPLLNLMVQAEKRIGISPERSKWTQYYNTLSFLWKSFAEEWHPTDALFHNCSQIEYHLDYERIRDERKAKGITQEEFADGIYQDTSSLSRFETGRVSPNKKTFEKMLDKLGLERGRYSGYVVTDSFEVMELRRHMDIQLMQHRYANARETLKKLKQCLDLTIAENKTVIEFHEILIADRIGELSVQTALEKIQELIKEILYHIPTRNEVLMLNHYCLLLRETGQIEKADKIFECALQKMCDSKVQNEYRYRSYVHMLNNYAYYHKDREKSIAVLKFELLCGKASIIPFCLNNVLKVLEKEGASDQELDWWSKILYYMSDFYYFHKEKEIYKTYLREKRKIDIID